MTEAPHPLDAAIERELTEDMEQLRRANDNLASQLMLERRRNQENVALIKVATAAHALLTAIEETDGDLEVIADSEIHEAMGRAMRTLFYPVVGANMPTNADRDLSARDVVDRALAYAVRGD